MCTEPATNLQRDFIIDGFKLIFYKIYIYYIDTNYSVNLNIYTIIAN